MSTNRVEPPSAETLDEARRAIEAMLLVATDPTPDQLLAQLLELPIELVAMMCRELAAEYDEQGRGFQLVEIAGGWRFQTHPETHPYVERYALEGIPNRLSSAALETLAIVAYKQPISRGQISAIRSVNVDAVLRTLVQRGYVEEHGKDEGPGQAALFGTTPFFLEQLGLMSTDDLPALGEFVPSAQVLEALEQTLKIDGEDPTVGLSDDPDDSNGSTADGSEASDISTSTDANGTIDAAANGQSSNGHSQNGHQANGNHANGDERAAEPDPADSDSDSPVDVDSDSPVDTDADATDGAEDA